MVDVEPSVFGNSPPPRKTDVLFGAGEDSEANACVNYGCPADAYRKGYRRGALQLTEQVLETGSDQDLLIYPIVYLYRHHVELVLKSIISIASKLLDRELSESDSEAMGHHGLQRLWAAAKPLLNPVCEAAGNSPFPSEDLEGIDSYIQQVHKYDPGGASFRYASKIEKKRVTRISTKTKSVNRLCPTI